MNCEELYVSHAEYEWQKFNNLLMFQADVINKDAAIEWLNHVLSKPSTVSTVFDKYFDYQKLIYIYNKYQDEQEIKQKCELIINTICGIYERKMRYLSRIELKELPLSE